MRRDEPSEEDEEEEGAERADRPERQQQEEEQTPAAADRAARERVRVRVRGAGVQRRPDRPVREVSVCFTSVLTDDQRVDTDRFIEQLYAVE